MFRIIVLSVYLTILVASAETVTVHVPEITCGACAQVIKESFRKISGVTEVDVDVKAKDVKITTEKAVSLSDKQIRDALLAYKYSASSIDRDL